MPQKQRMECFRLLLEYLAWIEHEFLSSIRDSRKAGILWGMIRGVGGVRKSIDQSWLAKGLGLGLVCWGFKGVQEEIPREEASTPEIGSVAFPLGHNSILITDYLTKMGSRQFLNLPIVQTLFPVTQLFFKLRGGRYETTEKMKEAVTKVIDILTQEDFDGAFQKLLERYQKCIAAGGDYFEGGLEFHVCTINKSAHTKNVWKLAPRIYIYIYITTHKALFMNWVLQ